MSEDMEVPQFRPYVGHDDYERLRGVFERKWLAEGPCAEEFHERLLDLTGAPYGRLASNGTLALYLALKALGIGPGDEVIVQDLTFIASGNAVEMVGAEPRFADIRSYDDPTIDLERVEVTSDTRAVVVAHLFGSVCSNIEEIAEFCQEHGVYLVEDAAQALGITDGENHCGTFGDVGTFSFYADKTITTGEGGFVVTDDEEVHRRMGYLRNQGRAGSGSFVHPEIGYNFRMTDMQCALGLAQLDKFEEIVSEKRRVHELYAEHLGDAVNYLVLRDDFSYIPFRVVAFVPDAERSLAYMQERGVGTRAMFHPLHAQPCYDHLGYGSDEFPNSVACHERGLCLPTWVGLSEEQIRYTSEVLLESLA